MTASERKKPKKYGRAQRRIVVVCLTVAVVVAATLCAVVGSLTWKKNYSSYVDHVAALSNLIASYVDADTVKPFIGKSESELTTTEKADYDDINQFLVDVTKAENFSDCCIIVPKDDGVVFIWDADTTETRKALGEKSSYVEGEKDVALNAFNSSQSETFFENVSPFGTKRASLYSPIYDGATSVALVCVDARLDDVLSDCQKNIWTVVGIIVGVVAVITAIMLLITQKFVLRPVKKLNAATKSVVENLDKTDDFVVDIHTGDEVEELADSFKTMVTDVKNYLKKLKAATAEKERVRAESSIAADIQNKMLPKNFDEVSKDKSFGVYALMRPAKQVGGDFYDFFMTGDDRLCIGIADVADKGMPAALFMAMAKATLKNYISAGMTPNEAFTKMNDEMLKSDDDLPFVSAWFGIYEISAKTLTFSDAGHEPPIIKKSDGKVVFLTGKKGVVIAGLKNVKYQTNKIKLSDGDVLLSYTDGLSEAQNPSGEFFGRERLIKTIEGINAYTPKQVVFDILKSVDEFTCGAAQFDDITINAFIVGDCGVTVKCDGGNLQLVQDYVQKKTSGILSKKAITELNVAVEEIYTNISKYAYGKGEKNGDAVDTNGIDELFGTITIKCEANKSFTEVSFIDYGFPYDPTIVPVPDLTLPAEKREVGGLGITLIKKLTDSVTYFRDGDKNVLTIRKNVKTTSKNKT